MKYARSLLHPCMHPCTRSLYAPAPGQPLARPAPQVLALLRADAAVALVSDAGMPAINDPGAQLVAAAAAAGLPVVPIPGPSAVLTALVGSGLPTERFTFCGYTPPKGSARRSLFAELRGASLTRMGGGGVLWAQLPTWL